MIDDTSRKILQILWNKNRMAETRINIKSLSRMAQRTESKTLRAIIQLRDAGYIEWDPTYLKVRILMKENIQISPISIMY